MEETSIVAGMTMTALIDSRKRSALKTISWRALGTMATIGIAFTFTKKVAISLGIGLVEVTAKLVLYYVHERVWNAVNWGKEWR